MSKQCKSFKQVIHAKQLLINGKTRVCMTPEKET